MRAERQVERDAAMAAGHAIDDLAPEIGIPEPAMGENDRRPPAALERHDLPCPHLNEARFAQQRRAIEMCGGGGSHALLLHKIHTVGM
jgi:hypothetical protein